MAIINGQGRVGIRSIAVPSTPSIITNGLILNLDATDPASYPGTGTTWSDLSGGGHHATLVNGPTYNSANGGYLQFDGVNDYALGHDVGPLLHLTNKATISVWFRTSTHSNNPQYILSLPYSSAGFNMFDLMLADVNSNGTVTLHKYSDSISSNYTYSSGSWINIVATSDGTNLKLYINNTLVGTQASTINFLYNYDNEYDIARFGSYGAYTNCDISQVLVYNRGLTPTEVTSNFNSTKTRYGL